MSDSDPVTGLGRRPAYGLATLLLVLPVLAGCGTETEPVVNTVALTGPNHVVVGQTIQLTGTVTSSGGSVSPVLTWTSGASGVASVSSTGSVTGVSVGTAAIMATSQEDPSASASQTVTVSPPQVWNIAHRGASAYAPENTLAAFDLALQPNMGADYFELDVQLTKDSVAVVLHDATLDRTTRGNGCTGLVRARTLAEIRQCDAGSWFNEAFPSLARVEYVDLRIPTLEEVFQRYGTSTRYLMETKYPEDTPGLEEEVVRLIALYGLVGTEVEPGAIIVMSFDEASVRRVRDLDSRLTSGRFWFLNDGSVPWSLLSTYADAIGPQHEIVDVGFMSSAEGAGVSVIPWIADDFSDLTRLINLGVDGIITNYPDRLSALLMSSTSSHQRSGLIDRRQIR